MYLLAWMNHSPRMPPPPPPTPPLNKPHLVTPLIFSSFLLLFSRPLYSFIKFSSIFFLYIVSGQPRLGDPVRQCNQSRVYWLGLTCPRRTGKFTLELNRFLWFGYIFYMMCSFTTSLRTIITIFSGLICVGGV